MPTKSINCPQCGDRLPLTFLHSKLVVCASCHSTIFLEDDAVRLAGKQSVLAEIPSLIQIQQPFSYQSHTYFPVGHVRYQYDSGFWDEWWVFDEGGEGVWVSVDEGDFAFEKPVKAPANITFEKLTIDTKINNWRVTERGTAVCDSFEGELPEIIKSGDQFDYVHLSKPDGQLLTLEFSDNSVKAYKGKWVDPFEITVNT